MHVLHFYTEGEGHMDQCQSESPRPSPSLNMTFFHILSNNFIIFPLHTVQYVYGLSRIYQYRLFNMWDENITVFKLTAPHIAFWSTILVCQSSMFLYTALYLEESLLFIRSNNFMRFNLSTGTYNKVPFSYLPKRLFSTFISTLCLSSSTFFFFSRTFLQISFLWIQN